VANVMTEPHLNRAMIALAIGAAVLLLVEPVPAWARILPWIIVFGYPLWRMARSRRSARDG
jgi:hypothetical protein